MGSLKEGTVSYQGQVTAYHVMVCRDSYFGLLPSRSKLIPFELTSNGRTKPCILLTLVVLQVSYILSGPRLTVSYTVHNPNASLEYYTITLGVIQL